MKKHLLIQTHTARSNKKFKAKCIRDEMTLYKSEPVNVDKATYYLSKVLDDRELKWVEQQKIVTKERLQQLCNAALKAEEYVHVLLRKCKAWKGPFTTVEELEACVAKTTDDEKLKTILRTEVSYRRHTSPRDYQARTNLYRLNQITTAELKVNLTLILTSDTENIEALQDMPTEEDMIKVFKLDVQHVEKPDDTELQELPASSQPSASPEVEVNEPCIVIWDINDKRQWFVGICISDHNDGTYTVEHLERSDPSGDGSRWRYPKRSDIQTVSVIQILPCNIVGSWDMSKRIMTFVLNNFHMIDVLFRSFY